jgi:DNA-binding beta-propeller fold protein YncE
MEVEMKNAKPRIAFMLSGGFCAVCAVLVATVAAADARQFLPHIAISSTVPGNGDLNPYGVAVIPRGFPSGGAVAPGDVLVSNFNNSDNLQGTGTTIVKFTPGGPVAAAGSASVFFSSSASGLSTALGVLRRGFIVVGNVPTADGTFATLGPGSLQFIDRKGKLKSTYTSSLLDGPWDLTIADGGSRATLFVSNVENGTVIRLALTVSATGVAITNATVIAMGYSVAPNAAALILGPTGLAYDPDTDVLYVASTNDNAIFAVTQAGSRTTPVNQGVSVFADPHLRGPLALAFAPNGHLITANGDAVNGDPTQPSEIVEFTAAGRFVGQSNVDPGQGGAFGLAVAQIGKRARFATVDDNTASLTVDDLLLPQDMTAQLDN